MVALWNRISHRFESDQIPPRVFVNVPSTGIFVHYDYYLFYLLGENHSKFARPVARLWGKSISYLQQNGSHPICRSNDLVDAWKGNRRLLHIQCSLRHVERVFSQAQRTVMYGNKGAVWDDHDISVSNFIKMLRHQLYDSRLN